MDHFGIGNGVHGVVQAFFQGSRRTGRTASLVASLKDGDRVVFTNEREGRRVQRLCMERGVKIEIVVSSPENPGRLFLRRTPSGYQKALFDRSWVAGYYENPVFTARAYRASDQTIAAIQDWTEKHIGHRLRVTCTKDYGMVQLWDDCAVSVEPNTGLPRLPDGLD